MSELDLYHPLILQRNKNPLFYSNEGKGQLITAYNPVCGDEFQIAIQIAENKIKKITFTGYGCAVSKAAIDMLIERLLNLDPVEAIKELNQFISIIDSDQPPAIESYPLAVFQKVKYHPSRRDCAVLGSQAIVKFLEDHF